MAVVINGARVDEHVYEFGVERDGQVYECDDYDEAKFVLTTNDHPEKSKLKMRCVYYTEWMDAK